MTKLDPRVAAVKKRIKAELDRQIADNWSDEQIREKIEALLKQSFDEVVAISLGFERDSWGRRNWSVDHCNGRAGESTIGQRIATAAKQAVDDVILGPEHRDKFTLSKGQIDALAKEFKERVNKSSLDKTIAYHTQKQVAALDELLSGKLTGAK